MRALLFLLLATACGDPPFAPPASARRVDPPPGYREVWARLETCAGRSGNFERIRWWFVPDSLQLHGEQVAGVWTPSHDIWVIEALARDPWHDYWIARHEMLHELLDTGDHPAPVFERCGSVNPLP